MKLVWYTFPGGDVLAVANGSVYGFDKDEKLVEIEDTTVFEVEHDGRQIDGANALEKHREWMRRAREFVASRAAGGQAA